MDAKLTVKLDKETIEKAKQFARKRNISLSRMIERYFQALVSKERQGDDENYTALIKELSGIISIDQAHDFDDEYSDYLIGKYT